jgi:hypothetical protein
MDSHRDAASALAMHIDGRTFSALGRLVVRSAARREGWGLGKGQGGDCSGGGMVEVETGRKPSK